MEIRLNEKDLKIIENVLKITVDYWMRNRISEPMEKDFIGKYKVLRKIRHILKIKTDNDLIYKIKIRELEEGIKNKIPLA